MKIAGEGKGMKVFTICGITNSGKTTTTERVIAELIARGYKVGSVKHIHCDKFKMDPDVKEDTGRHRIAGSQIITAHARRETSVMFARRLPTDKLLSLYQGEVDWVVCEGVSDIPLPTIVTAHKEEDLVQKWNNHVFCISGVISFAMTEYRGKPVFSAKRDIVQLVDFIENNVGEWGKH